MKWSCVHELHSIDIIEIIAIQVKIHFKNTKLFLLFQKWTICPLMCKFHSIFSMISFINSINENVFRVRKENALGQNNCEYNEHHASSTLPEEKWIILDTLFIFFLNKILTSVWAGITFVRVSILSKTTVLFKYTDSGNHSILSAAVWYLITF